MSLETRLRLNVKEAHRAELRTGYVIRAPGDYEKLRSLPTLDGVTIIGDVHEKDPTVPEWAKEETRPNYTAEDVGAVSKSEIGELSIETLTSIWDSV